MLNKDWSNKGRPGNIPRNTRNFGLGALMSGSILAGPADYIFLPTVEYGEREIDFKIGSGRQPAGAHLSAATLGFGYGVTERWFTEVYLKYQKQGGDGIKLDALEWESKFQLTETGKYPVDMGLITEIEVPRDRSEGYEIKIGPLPTSTSSSLTATWYSNANSAGVIRLCRTIRKSAISGR